MKQVGQAFRSRGVVDAHEDEGLAVRDAGHVLAARITLVQPKSHAAGDLVEGEATILGPEPGLAPLRLAGARVDVVARDVIPLVRDAEAADAHVARAARAVVAHVLVVVDHVARVGLFVADLVGTGVVVGRAHVWDHRAGPRDAGIVSAPLAVGALVLVVGRVDAFTLEAHVVGARLFVVADHRSTRHALAGVTAHVTDGAEVAVVARSERRRERAAAGVDVARVDGTGLAVVAVRVGRALGRLRALVQGVHVAPPNAARGLALRLRIVGKALEVVLPLELVLLVGRDAGRIVTVHGAHAAVDERAGLDPELRIDHDGLGAVAVGALALVDASGRGIRAASGRDHAQERQHGAVLHHLALHRVLSSKRESTLASRLTRIPVVHWPHCGTRRAPLPVR